MSFALRSLILVPLLVAGAAQAAITNGDFENALTGWSTYTSAGAVPGFSAVGSVGTPASLAPGGGATMAVVHAGAVGDYQRLWQDFSVLGDAASISMLVRWNGDDFGEYNDDGYARISQLDESGNPAASTTLWTADVAQWGDFINANGGNSPWMPLNYSFASAGRYRIEFGVRNVLDDLEDQSSEVFVDNVALVDPVAAPVPEPGEWAMIAAGLGLVGFVARRRKASAA